MSGTDPKLLGLSTLLQLQRDVRHAQDFDQFHFLVVNDARRLIEYHQAALARLQPGGGVDIEAVSGLARTDPNSPYVAWLRKALRHLAQQPNATETHPIARDDLPAALHEGWTEWTFGHCLWCPIAAPSGQLLGALWLNRKRAWEEAEIGLLGHLCDAYGHAWAALLQRDATWSSRFAHRALTRKTRWTVAALLLGLMLLPVRQSVLAPAEVIAQQPFIVSAPLEGVIKTFHIQPNGTVAAGDLLFSMDDTTVRNRHEIAQKALAVAQADYLRAAQKAFREDESKAEVALLQARVDEKSAEVRYTAELLERSRVRAERAGIAVFSDVNDWLGRPVVVGEKILTLADPQRTELQIELPMDDAINLEPGAQVRVFLNIAPTRPLAASLRETSYEAQVTPAGILAFRLKATFEDAASLPRIGLRGTAKVYGGRVTLFYYLMRRPIGALRQALGI